MGMEEIKQMLLVNHNIILHGAPGTGKTYLAKEIAKAMCDVDDIKKLEDSGQFKMVQFHPSYDYTDFVEGLRPTDKDEDGNKLDAMQFVRKDGVFKEFCKKAIINRKTILYPNIISSNLRNAWNSLWDDINDNKIQYLPNKDRGDSVKLFTNEGNRDKISFYKINESDKSDHCATFDCIKDIHEHFGNPSSIENVKDILKVRSGQTSTLWAIYNEVYKRSIRADIVEQTILVNAASDKISIEELKKAWSSLIKDISNVNNSITLKKQDNTHTPKLVIDTFVKDSAQHNNKKGDKRIAWGVDNQYCSWGYIEKVHDECISPNNENVYSIIKNIAKGAYYNIIWAIYNEVYNRALKIHNQSSDDEDKTALVEKESPFIFLIDEINRGDMSKIFGELFYAIDPGYRGEKGKIDTQYQNLVTAKYKDENGYEQEDPFHKGFYVPDNVYIIGTMNDIDRSVESMDFAMRRRFQFIEVTAEDRAEGMGLKTKKQGEEGYDKTEAYNRMTNLNNCIISKEVGLSKAYQIGGSYFLKEKIKDGKKISVPIASDDEFKNLWDYRLKGLLREYLRGEEEHSAKEKMEILEKAFNFGYLFKDTEQEPIQNIQNEGNTPDNGNE